MKITIGGCRDFEDYELFKEFVAECIKKMGHEKITILSGHCSGADIMGEKYADEHGYEIEIHLAEWKKYGRAAGPLRNAEMVKESDVVIAFWDGKSKGTKSLVDCAKKSGKVLFVKMI